MTRKSNRGKIVASNSGYGNFTAFCKAQKAVFFIPKLHQGGTYMTEKLTLKERAVRGYRSGNVKKCAVGKHPKSEKHGNTAQER